ncbi:SRPBCC family protein [Streptomyces sp. NPDC048243]|uniref:SRPBCC family protein n=1 Tax=Streptomyces sp. NPDC048243 TaxID=3365522 RepID=UPI003712D1F1
MSGERVRRLRHSAEVAAPAEVVYALLADAVRRPLYSAGVVHVERMDAEGNRERLRVWEHAGGRVRCSLWARVAHPGELRIEFWRLSGEAPIASMAGQWSVSQAAGGHGCVVSVVHEFTVAAGSHGAQAARAALAAGDNARSALRSVRRIAEGRGASRQRVLRFQESLRIEGPGEVVYDFLYRAGDWAGRVPHVRHVELSEVSPGIQSVDYRLRLPDSTVRATRSLRLCFPHAGRIVHKTTTPWAPVAAHTGEWSVLPDEHGVRVIAEHTVLLDEHATPPDGAYAIDGQESTGPSGTDTAPPWERAYAPPGRSATHVLAWMAELSGRQEAGPEPLPGPGLGSGSGLRPETGREAATGRGSETGRGQRRSADSPAGPSSKAGPAPEDGRGRTVRGPAGQGQGHGPVQDDGGMRGADEDGGMGERVRDAIGQASRAILEQAARHAESAVQALPRR